MNNATGADSYDAKGPYAPIESVPDTPVALPKTPLGDVAGLLLAAQQLLRVANRQGAGDANLCDSLMEINDKLAQARILVDVLRGGPDG